MALIGWSLILASVLYIAIRRPPFLETLVSLCRGSPAPTPPPRIQPPSTEKGGDQGTSSAVSVRDDSNKDENASAIKRRPDGPRSEPARRSSPAPGSNPTITNTETPSPPPESQTTPKATAQTGPMNTESIPSFSLSTDADPPPSAAAVARAAAGASPPSPQQTTLLPAAANMSMPPPPIPRIPKLNNLSPSPNLRSGGSGSSSSLLAAPARPSPIPDRLRQAQYDRQPGTSTLAPPPTHNSKPAKPSRKVTLEPGHSPLDWARLANHPTADLRGLGPGVTGYIRVTPSMLKRQTGRRGKDAWTALGGRVYNMTPYLPFHPGGEPELLRAAGRDGTKLFGEIHPWVNYETMLSSCLIGLLVDEDEAQAGSGDMDAMD